MFRVLSNEESHLVKKWRAPSLGDSESLASPLADNAMQLLRAESVTAADITNLRDEGDDTYSGKQASNDEYSVEAKATLSNHSSLAMLSPSADMLQQTYDEGFAAGAKSTKSNSDSVTADRLLSLLNNLSAQKYQIDTGIEQEVVSLAKAIAKMLLRREVETEDGVILDIVRSALAQMPKTTEPPTVSLHPADLEIIQSMQTTSMMATLKPNTEMLRGECRIESGASILEAGIDALVESISSCSTQPLQANDVVEHDVLVDTDKVDE